MKTDNSTLLAAALAVGALSTPALQAQLPASNPFAAPSTLPFQAPAFDKIKDATTSPRSRRG